MVDLQLDDEARMIVKAVGEFMEQEVVPYQEKYREVIASGRKRLTDEGRLKPELIEISKDIRRKSAEQGFYAMHLPEEMGGGDVDRTTVLKAYQEVYKHGLGFSFAVLASIEGPSMMLQALDEDQRERWLDPMVRGEKTTAFALTEPQAGSDIRNIQTTAEKDDDGWVLDGTKTFVTNGPYCDFAQVFAKTGEVEGYGGITAFIVEKGTDGFEVSPPQDTISSDGLQCEFHFDGCRVPDENVIGEPGEGFFHAMQNINDTRLQLGGVCLGLARYCIDETIPYVTERKAFGKPISKFQGVSHPLADAETRLTAAEQLALLTAWKVDQGEQPLKETSMTKLYCTEMLWDVADACVQAWGGLGVTKEVGLESVLRYARVMRIYEGTSEIQRNTIAKTMGL